MTKSRRYKKIVNLRAGFAGTRAGTRIVLKTGTGSSSKGGDVVVYERPKKTKTKAKPKGEGTGKRLYRFFNVLGQQVAGRSWSMARKAGAWIQRGGSFVHKKWTELTPAQRKFIKEFGTNLIRESTGVDLDNLSLPIPQKDERSHRLPDGSRDTSTTTTTKKDRKSKQMAILRYGNDSDKITYSNYKQGKYRPKAYGDFIVRESLKDTLRVVSAYCKQISVGYSVLTRNQLSTAFSAWFPTANTSTGDYTATQRTLDKSAGFFIKRCAIEYEIAASANILSHLYIYDLLPKDDSIPTAIEDWEEAVNNQSYGTSPTHYGHRGVSVVGNFPEDYGPFLRRWKICKKTTVALSPGEIHKHKAVFNLNYKFMEADYATSSSDLRHIRYTTPHTMFILHGSTVHDTDVSVTAGLQQSANINYGPAAIDIVLNRSLTLSSRPEFSYRIFRDNSDTSFTEPKGTTVDESGTETTVVS